MLLLILITINENIIGMRLEALYKCYMPLPLPLQEEYTSQPVTVSCC